VRPDDGRLLAQETGALVMNGLLEAPSLLVVPDAVNFLVVALGCVAWGLMLGGLVRLLAAASR
jgi:hypothetical protein